MDPRLRTTLVFVFASLLAAFLGWQVAEGAYALPAFAAAAIIATLLVKFTGLPLDIITVGLLLFGYIVGNRGFAQLMIPGLPLLPAEAGLLLAVSWRGILCAFSRRLPFRFDALNWAVLAWLLVGTVRVVFDFPQFRMLALRDYAQVYYAVFFLLAQHMGRDPVARRYLFGCLQAGLITLVPMFALFQLFPDFFMNRLTLAGVPLVYYKGDLAVTFLAIGALLTFQSTDDRQRAWAWPVVAAMLLLAFSGGNRASLLGSIIASGLLLAARRWRWPAFQGAVAGLALLGLLGLATLFDHTWSEKKLHNLSDQALSVVDVSGSGRYESEDSFNKGDNNRFRLIWWKNVVEETWSSSPVFGLGFGADLAHGFVQEYYADATEEFTTRSPHNVFLTVFGRMGVVGLVVWLGFCATLLAATWRNLRHASDPRQWSLWCGAWVILVSASFGVVLEGPMGAVVFWTVLGLANSYPAESSPAAAATTAMATDPA